MTAEEVADFVRSHDRVLAVGAGTVPAAARAPSGCARLSLAGFSGITEYDPSEYTFTALAGTPLAEIQAALARHGQYLPFDPPLARAGATLGGTVAAGLSGPGRVRYGGVRDFILGVRFVTGAGEVVRGGGKVVKNAAGFDFPKLFVGSLGRLGVLLEATFKVFPRPSSMGSISVEFPDFAGAVAAIGRLSCAPFDLEGLELDPPGRMTLRLGGAAETLPDRLERLGRFVGGSGRVLSTAEDAAFWNVDPWEGLTTGGIVAKVPLNLSLLADFEAALAPHGAGRRYSAAGNVAWLAWPGGGADLGGFLAGRGLSGLVLRGKTAEPLLGARPQDAFRSRIKRALDPTHRFPDL